MKSESPRRGQNTVGAEAESKQSQPTASPAAFQLCSPLARALSEASETGAPLVAALAYARAGMPVFPCSPQDKQPLTRFGFKDASTEARQIRNWWTRSPDAMIGLRTGPDSGVFVLDVDVDPEQDIDGFVALAALEKQYGALPETLRSVTPRGGSHYFFRWHDGIKNSASVLGTALDIRGLGGYVVLPPSQRSDGRSYEWAELSAAEPCGAPAWLIDRLLAPKEKPAPQPLVSLVANGGVEAYASAALERECATIETAQSGTRNHSLNRAAFSLFQLVAAGALPESKVRDRLYGAALACGLVADDGADAVRATIESGASAGLKQPRLIPELRTRYGADGNSNGANQAGPKQDDASTANKLTSGNTWKYHNGEAPVPQRWLVKRILPETGVALMPGQWGSFKTSVALDLSVCVMAKLRFAGRYDVKRRGAVLYLALEGEGMLPARLSAIAAHHGVSGALPFAWRGDCPALSNNNAAAELCAIADEAAAYLDRNFGLPVVLIWIDTVITAAGHDDGGDNDTAASQKVMSVLRVLSKHTGALVVGIDHFGKVVETGTRGSSAKEGAADTVIALLADRELSGGVKNTRLAVRKQRDGVSGFELPFAARTVETGADDDGDPITASVIDWRATQLTTQSDARLTPSMQLLRRLLMTCLADSGQSIQPFLDGPEVRAVDIGLVREEFYRQHPANGTDKQKAEARRKAFNRSLQRSLAAGVTSIREVDGVQLIWLSTLEATGA